MFRSRLRSIFDDTSSGLGLVLDNSIQILILVSMVSFAVETLPDNPLWLVDLLQWIEIVCVAIFTLEYVLRLYAAEKPLSYIFSFYGIIDLLAILPFYFSSGITDLRAIRIFRIFRIFRSLKLIRYNDALNRFSLAAKIVKEEIVLFMIVTGILIFLTASGIYMFENEAQPEVFSSVFHSFWWTIVTLTTVGYGDVYPITTGGRVFTFFVLIIGVGLVTVPAGLVASALGKARQMEDESKYEDLIDDE